MLVAVVEIYFSVCRLEGAEEPQVFGFCQRAEHPDEEQAGDSRAAASVRLTNMHTDIFQTQRHGKLINIESGVSFSRKVSLME